MSKRAIYYDTETTGVKAERDRIIELAAYDPVQNRTFCEFINPGIPIPEECTQIHGISDEMVKDAKDFKEVGQAFFDFCQGEVILIAHNNDAFDKHFLVHESRRSSLIMPNFPFLDTLKWARKYRPDLPRHSLQYLREIYGIEENRAHRALDDVLVLHKIFSLMIGDLSIEIAHELAYQQGGSSLAQMPFGKHRGEPLDKLPKHYVKWLAGSGALDKPENELLKQAFEKLALL